VLSIGLTRVKRSSTQTWLSFDTRYSILLSMTPRVTSTDIARHAGVSRTTVSFVLNQIAGVSSKTRDRVLMTARKLGYVPNSAARMLVSGRSHTLGLVISRADLLLVDAFIPRLIYGIGRVCNSSGYKLLVEAVEDRSDPSAYLDLARSKRIDALMVLNPQVTDKGLVKLIEMRFPVIIFGSIRHPKENSVNTDDLGAGREATAHLISLGHRHIAHISYASLSYLAADARFQGYHKALKEAGIAFNKRLLAIGHFSSESGFDAMNEILRHRVIPTALFASNDTIAIGAMAAIRAAGLSVPADMAVVGFDDLPFAAFTNPALTTIRSQPKELGEHAVRAAISLLEGKRVGIRRRVIPLELIVRESCGAANRQTKTCGQRSKVR
jgi:DNA-binding LacI/PurR family transcriptional regulator